MANFKGVGNKFEELGMSPKIISRYSFSWFPGLYQQLKNGGLDFIVGKSCHFTEEVPHKVCHSW